MRRSAQAVQTSGTGSYAGSSSTYNHVIICRLALAIDYFSYGTIPNESTKHKSNL
jgi:hypothetical protein